MTIIFFLIGVNFHHGRLSKSTFPPHNITATFFILFGSCWKASDVTAAIPAAELASITNCKPSTVKSMDFHNRGWACRLSMQNRVNHMSYRTVRICNLKLSLERDKTGYTFTWRNEPSSSAWRTSLLWPSHHHSRNIICTYYYILGDE